MRFDGKSVMVITLFVFLLISLRQGIVFVSSQSQVFSQQVELMDVQEIDPASLFYTDSQVALRAIRKVDRQIGYD